MTLARILLVAATLGGGVLLAGDPDPEPAPGSTDTIARLIEAAEPGSTVRVPPGVYLGSLVVDKPVVLEGGGAAVIDGEGTGTIVVVSVGGVTFRGFTVRASGKKVEREPAGIRVDEGPVIIEDNTFRDVLFGIDLRTAPGSIIRRNDISGKSLEPGRRGDGIRIWWCQGCTIEDNTLRGVRDAVFWYSEDCTIRRNRVTDGRYGLHFMYSHNTVVSENTLDGNSVGMYLMYSNGITIRDNAFIRNRGTSGYGIGLKDCDNVHCENNQILANRVGIYSDRCPFSIDGTGVFQGNRIGFNDIGMALTPQTQRNIIIGNTFLENEEQIAVKGRGSLKENEFSRDGRGNFWSNYAGFDRNGDGVGDLPYRSVSLFENLLDRQPLLRFFVHSPAQQAIEFTARAMPGFQPEPKFTDPNPLMRAPVAVAASEAGSFRGAMLAVAIGLLGIGGASLYASQRSPAPRMSRTRNLSGKVRR